MNPESKRQAEACHVIKSFLCGDVGCPGGTERATRAETLLLGLFCLLGLFRLLRLLRFLSHSILSRFNGLNATPRHAWRRASLATSSMTIPTDSRRPAAWCHDAVVALSTALMRFDAIFLRNVAMHGIRVAAPALTRPDPSSLHPIKTTRCASRRGMISSAPNARQPDADT